MYTYFLEQVDCWVDILFCNNPRDNQRDTWPDLDCAALAVEANVCIIYYTMTSSSHLGLGMKRCSFGNWVIASLHNGSLQVTASYYQMI